ncbi:MAG: hypothetical protein MRY32_09725 [Rickettsiales bacterium]|nr:hypothetical protein [Rickettsiales bacterium]
MDPMTLMMVVFVGLPLLGFVVFFLPIYFGILTSLYIIYEPQDMAANPVGQMKFKIGKVIDSWQRLYDHWVLYGDALSFQDFTMPLLAPPVLGLIVSVYLTYRYAMYCRGIFRL